MIVWIIVCLYQVATNTVFSGEKLNCEISLLFSDKLMLVMKVDKVIVSYVCSSRVNFITNDIFDVQFFKFKPSFVDRKCEYCLRGNRITDEGRS